MVKENPENSSPFSPSIDPRSGFCSKTQIFHSLRLSASLPPETTPLSFTSYFFSLLRHHPTTTAAFIDGATRHRILHSELQLRVKSLAFCIHQEIGLSKGDCAFVLAPNSPEIPVLFLSLFSFGVIVCPSNPANSVLEISEQVNLSKPLIAFTTHDLAQKLPSFLRHRTVLLDSPEFISWMLKNGNDCNSLDFQFSEIYQSDTAAILFSSGTTGRFKGVELTHKNFISAVAGSNAARPARQKPPVILCTVPFFHIYGFLMSIRDVAFGATMISMKKFDFRLMMRIVEEIKATHLALAPPAVVLMVNNADLMSEFDLSSLEVVLCAGAPLANAVIERFRRRFPNAAVAQAYGLTETTGGATRTLPGESQRLGTVGRLVSDCQAKIVDPDSDNDKGLTPLRPGELWIRGPSVMKGYLADKEATDATLNQDGWLRTGDICYFDNEGFLFYVDRIKELIKYKAYQIAPAELEHLLLSHPDITNAAVIPYPDEEAGEVPVAFVVRKSGSSIDEESIIQFIARQVSPYKKIRKVFFINSIPTNAPGKVLRKELINLVRSSSSSSSSSKL
ncbi:hypothetical protein M9H77_10293 [Catharanthus roseus]|uniref:Uncharacterized protein n=1 Tax=Catharanthus roseus TaxID=4058 RepID=A0ACC0C2Z0_CATRO|nr:hypothetical protein M9H77_10293 [Catharanthus roseus]